MSHPIITFTSDFGYQDWFVGVVHGVVLGICPAVRIVDLTHAVEPGNVPVAAFVLEICSANFPPGTIHLVVVDPSVGTDRIALAVRARSQYFVGPDNGVLEWALADPNARVHALSNDHYFRKPVSRTFHARDVFAPVAAHLANGVELEAFGLRVERPVRLESAFRRMSDGRLEGRVAYIDHFGNALTNLTAEILADAFPRAPERDLVVEIVGRRIEGIARTYADSPIGSLVALIGSTGRLEIAEVSGHAASRFGFGVGDPVRVRVQS
jgi:S-adenosylmethionine hydrolase